MSNNLPLKKRRAYFIDSSIKNDENHLKMIKTSSSLQNNSYPIHVPTPPSSPHIELLRQQYAYLSANTRYHNHLMAQQYQLLQQQHYNQPKQQMNVTVDEHFKKSLRCNHNKCLGRCLTPDDSLSNSSLIERTPVDSIEEHFARSLAKFWPAESKPESSVIYHQITESVVDDHFAKALGSKTWDRLKEQC